MKPVITFTVRQVDELVGFLEYADDRIQLSKLLIFVYFISRIWDSMRFVRFYL